MTRRLVHYLLITGVILFAVSWWRADSLPAKTDLLPELLAEPIQEAINQPAFDTTVNGITYRVQPLYTYDLTGMVVSMHDAKTWWDHLHREWNDNLNVTDLCVVWGNNVRKGAYEGISFSSGQFTCNFFTRSQQAYEAFDQTAISNNHLLTSDPAIAKALRKVRVGDQIRFTGVLAEYSHNHGFPFKRGTSTVRTDTGNGACETVYVDRIDILQSGGGIWRSLKWLGLGLIVFGVIAWFRLPLRNAV